MKKLIYFLFLMTIVIFLKDTYATKITKTDNVFFDNISYRDGLSQNSVYTIVQDKIGFLWFGTDSGGLNKYDGYTFTTYKHDFESPNSLTDNSIFVLYEDSLGRLWIGTGDGLDQFNKNRNNFIHYKHDPENLNSLSSNSISSLIEDDKGILWVGTVGGGVCRLIGENKFIHYKNNLQNNKSLSNNNVRCLSKDSKGNIWIGTRKGVNLWISKFSSFKHYNSDTVKINSLNNDDIHCIYEAPSQPGILWIGTNGGGLNRLNVEKNSFKHYIHNINNPHSLSDTYNKITSILEDRAGNLWIGTSSGGLEIFDREQKLFYHNKHNPERTGSLSINDVSALYQDRSGILWIGHELGGVDKFTPDKIKFGHYYNQKNNYGLSDNSVWSLFEDYAGVLWVGSRKGIDLISGTGKFINHYNSETAKIKLSHSIVYSICEDNNHNIWIGTIVGLNRINNQKNSIKHYFYDLKNRNSISNDTIYSLLIDSKNKLWVGTARGLNVYNSESDTFKRFIHNPDDYQTISDNFILSLFEDKGEQLWVGTAGGGISIFDKERKKIIHLKNKQNNNKSLSHNNVTCMSEDDIGNVWVGTGDGLNKWDIQRKHFIRYGYQQDLIDTSIGGLIFDISGHIWFSHTKGISRLNIESGVIKNYNTTDGVQNEEFNRGSFHKSKKGEYFFGGNNGFNNFYPDKIKNNKYTPKVVLTSFKLFNKDIISDIPVYIKKSYNLEYNQNYISFEFAALSYTEPLENQFAYKMEGIDKGWIYCGTQRLANYNNIPPGKYVFHIKASNNDGIWNEKGTSISINISPPFWETWWFILVILFLVLLVLFFFYRIRIKSIKSKLEAKHIRQEIKLKQDFVAMLVHDLGNPLNSIIGYSDYLKGDPTKENIQKTTDIISSSSEVMLRLIDDMLDVFKFEAGKLVLYKEKHSLEKIIKNSISLLNLQIRDKKLELKTDFQKLSKISIDSIRITQLINNLMSNAIKFSPKGGTLSLTLKQLSEKEKTYQKFIIKDDGPGISQEQSKYLFKKYSQIQNNSSSFKKGTGLGLAICKLIIKAHNGKIGNIPSSSGIFYFILPDDEV